MADSESDFKVGPGRPPLDARFKKGQSGNPGGRSAKSLPALLADALNETVVVMIDGRRRKITKREAIVTQMVDKSRAPPTLSASRCARGSSIAMPDFGQRSVTSREVDRSEGRT